MKRLAFFLTVLTIAAGSATAADAPRVEIFGGYSHLELEENVDVNGFDVSLAGNLNSWLGWIADYSRYERTFALPSPIGGGVGGDTQLFLFGPQLTLRAPRVEPFAHVLAGGARLSVGALGFSASDTAFAAAFGGGVDITLNRWVAIRAIQADYLVTRFFGETQNNGRFSIGLVLRLGH